MAALGAAAPYLAQMASQLTAERIKEWQALSGFDQKKAYLKKAIPKDSAIQDMLKNRDQAERIIAWLDHFIASGAAKTASEGAGVVVGETLGVAATAVGPSKMKALIRANPNTAAMAKSLIDSLPVAYNLLWSTDKKLKCLKRAAAPGSAAAQMLDSDEHAATLIEFIDKTHTALSNNLVQAKRNGIRDEFIDEERLPIGPTASAKRSIDPTKNYFDPAIAAHAITCPYTGKAVSVRDRVMRPKFVSGELYENAPWGHFSIATMDSEKLKNILQNVLKKKPTDPTAPPTRKSKQDDTTAKPRRRPIQISPPAEVDVMNTDFRENPAELPPGYSIMTKPLPAGKYEYHVLCQGKPIGKYAMTESKAAVFAFQHASGYVNPFSKEGRARAIAAKR